MKKVLLVIPFMMAGSIAMAQSTPAADDDMGIGFGIKGGWNSANMSIKTDGTVDDKNAISSFNVGGYFDFPIAPVFSLQAGLMFTGKGVKFTSGDKNGENWAESKTNPLYLELPVYAVGKIPLAPHTNIFFGAGPYAAMGVAGKTKTEGQLLGVSFSDESNIKFGDDDPTNGNNGSSNSGNVKRFDWGLNFMAGVEINHITLNANYGLGLANIAPGSSNNDNDKYKNRVFSLSVGFLFR